MGRALLTQGGGRPGRGVLSSENFCIFRQVAAIIKILSPNQFYIFQLISV